MPRSPRAPPDQNISILDTLSDRGIRSSFFSRLGDATASSSFAVSAAPRRVLGAYVRRGAGRGGTPHPELQQQLDADRRSPHRIRFNRYSADDSHCETR